MVKENQPATVCLEVAVDHRLRQLFKPVFPVTEDRPSGDHIEWIDILGRALTREGGVPKEEIAVMKQLARPESTGGIAIALSQPAHSHPYDLGAAVVIQSSPTFAALSEVLDAVSRDTLSLLDDVTVIDRQSFVRPKDRIPPEIQKVWRDGSFHAIRAKKPDVVLCMGQDRFKESGRAFVVESIGVGRVFEMPRIELCHGLWTKRINACHPSYVVNHNPHISCLRQLLILEISQACGIYRDDWIEEDWMGELRQRCRVKANELSSEQCMLKFEVLSPDQIY